MELLNYRKSGEEFTNLLSITPVRDAAGRLLSFIGVQVQPGWGVGWVGGWVGSWVGGSGCSESLAAAWAVAALAALLPLFPPSRLPSPALYRCLPAV